MESGDWKDALSDQDIPAEVCDWEAITGRDQEEGYMKGGTGMDIQRAQDIFASKDTFSVHLDGKPVWIEHVDAENGMATVQVGSRPTDTHTVSVDRLEEHLK